jgi:chromosome segregation ATPase
MTSSRYYIARFGQAFGYYRRNQRMADAASETHLLRDADAHLGLAVWQNVEVIEELAVEYWNLRKLSKQRSELHEKLVLCETRLEVAHEERASVINTTPEIHQELLDQRTLLLTELEQLAQVRDDIVTEAREIRRRHDGLKMKLEVLSKEATAVGPTGQPLDIAEAKIRLDELKAKFAKLKSQRIHIGEEIIAGDARVDAVDRQLSEKKVSRRADASESFQVIGEGNKEIAQLRAEIGSIDQQMRQLYTEVGRYISRHAVANPSCAKAAASELRLVEVMRALRHSIALNHRLAGMG